MRKPATDGGVASLYLQWQVTEDADCNSVAGGHALPCLTAIEAALTEPFEFHVRSHLHLKSLRAEYHTAALRPAIPLPDSASADEPGIDVRAARVRSPARGPPASEPWTPAVPLADNSLSPSTRRSGTRQPHATRCRPPSGVRPASCQQGALPTCLPEPWWQDGQ